eukprot:SAG31_NODE_337_length_17493_cov_5.855755_3_plen_80_part_00
MHFNPIDELGFGRFALRSLAFEKEITVSGPSSEDIASLACGTDKVLRCIERQLEMQISRNGQSTGRGVLKATLQLMDVE